MDEDNGNYEHQDWKEIIFKKKPTTQQSAPMLSPKQDRALNENLESFQTKYFDKAYVQTVIKARLEKKWSQKDLATRLNVDIAVIQRFERGSEVYNAALKSKMNRLLELRKASSA